MTNKEFYFDKLLAVALRNKTNCHLLHELVFGKSCQGKNCCDCEFNTVESIENWLNAEHVEPEPPLLENGDGLKIGDCIMVQGEHEISWEKHIFICYKDGLFWTIANANNLDEDHPYIHCWNQARLPMDGE